MALPEDNPGSAPVKPQDAAPPIGRQFHPVAELFPLMEGAELDELAEDIRLHGLREPILVHPDGRVIDGRNRYRACALAGVEPARKTWDGNGSLVALAVSLNLKRRHLTASQKGVVAADSLRHYEEEARERQEATRAKPGQPVPRQASAKLRSPISADAKGKATAAAARDFGISPRTVESARHVIRNGVTAIADRVRSGEISLGIAEKAVRQFTREHQEQVATLPPKELFKIVKEAGRSSEAARMPPPDPRIERQIDEWFAIKGPVWGMAELSLLPSDAVAVVPAVHLPRTLKNARKALEWLSEFTTLLAGR